MDALLAATSAMLIRNVFLQDQTFAPFADISPLQVSEYTVPAWLAAKAEFDMRMVPLEHKIAQHLQTSLRSDVLPALAAAVAKHADRAQTVSRQPSQARVCHDLGCVPVTQTLLRSALRQKALSVSSMSVQGRSQSLLSS